MECIITAQEIAKRLVKNINLLNLSLIKTK